MFAVVNFFTLNDFMKVCFLCGLAMMLLIIIFKLLLRKKVDYLSLFFFVATLILLLLPENSGFKIVNLIVFIVDFIYFIAACINFYFAHKIDEALNKKAMHHLKNDHYDYFLLMNKKAKIIDYSVSFSRLTNFSVKEMKRENGFEVLFKYFDIIKFNGETIFGVNANLLTYNLESFVSMNKMYEFKMEVSGPRNGEVILYSGLIQGIYFGKKLVGSALYLYQDKMLVVEQIKNKLDKAYNALIEDKNILHTLMNLSEGISLYYDFHDRMYYLTTNFSEYAKIYKEAIDFPEFFNLIHPDDQESYINQSATINSLAITRIKFRLILDETVFDAVEDSIYLDKGEEKLVSIIHILGLEGIDNSLMTSKELENLVKKEAYRDVESEIAEVDQKISHILDLEDEND